MIGLLLIGAVQAQASEDSVRSVRLSMPTMPPTRTTCEVRTSEQTVFLDWDPQFPSPLVKTAQVQASAADGAVQVQCWSQEPAWMSGGETIGMQPSSSYWRFEGTRKDTSQARAALSKGYAELLEAPGSLPDPLTNQLDQGTAKVRALGWSEGDHIDQIADKLEFVASCTLDPNQIRCPKAWGTEIKGYLQQLEESEDLTASVCLPDHSVGIGQDCSKSVVISVEFDAAVKSPLASRLHSLDTQLAGSSENRSLYSAAPAALTETLSSLGTIALKRAERGARQALADRMTADLCTDGLTVNELWASPVDVAELGAGYKLTLSSGENGYEVENVGVILTPTKVGFVETPCKDPVLQDATGGQIIDIDDAKSNPGNWKLLNWDSTWDPNDHRVRARCPVRYFAKGKVIPKGDMLEETVNLPEAHLILRGVPKAFETKPLDVDATVGKKGLAGGRLGPVLEIAFPNTCSVVQDRSFADLARSGQDLAHAMARDLIEATYANLLLLGSDDVETIELLEHTVRPLLEAVIPIVIDSLREGTNPDARDAQVVIATLRQQLKDGTDTSATCKTIKGAATLNLGLGILADCIEAGSCDLRGVAAKVANPESYFEDADGSCYKVHTGKLTVDQQRQLIQIVDGFYSAFAPDPNIDDRQRAVQTIAAAFDAVALAIELDHSATTDNRAALVPDLLEDLEVLVIAGIQERYGTMASAATSLVETTIRVAAYDDQCSKNVKADPATQLKCHRQLREVARQTARVLPWVTTLITHAEEIEAEQNGSFSDAELEEASKARQKALEDLIDANPSRKERQGELVVGIGANVGFRAAYGCNEQLVRCGVATNPLTLPMGVALQWLPAPLRTRSTANDQLKRRGRLEKAPFGTGLHLQVSPVDLGQFISLDVDELEKLSWNEFILFDAQLGVMLNTPANAFTIAFDYRYLPNEEQHQIGLLATYYVPFFDFN